jgi:hypothetical protein
MSTYSYSKDYPYYWNKADLACHYQDHDGWRKSEVPRVLRRTVGNHKRDFCVVCGCNDRGGYFQSHFVSGESYICQQCCEAIHKRIKKDKRFFKKEQLWDKYEEIIKVV